MELSSSRIWSYKGDNFVHRILRANMGAGIHDSTQEEILAAYEEKKAAPNEDDSDDMPAFNQLLMRKKSSTVSRGSKGSKGSDSVPKNQMKVRKPPEAPATEEFSMPDNQIAERPS